MLNRLRKYFLSGLVVFLPLALTIYLFVLAINFTDGLLGQYLEPYLYEKFRFYFPGLGIIVGVCIITATGFIMTNFLGKKVYDFFEKMLIKIPFFKQVYPAIKEMAIFLFSRDRMRFKKVVVIEYPRKGIYAIGFLTNDSSQFMQEKVQPDLVNVFIPSAPGPLTGYVLMVPKKDIVETEMSVEEAFKFIVSGGVVNPN